MGFITPQESDDERSDDSTSEDGMPMGQRMGLELDLDVRACPVCRRELLPWQEHCPEDGAAAVAKRDLPPAEPDVDISHLIDGD